MRAGVRRAGVQEMDAEPVDRGHELGHDVQPRLSGAPIVGVEPVAAEIPQVAERDPLRPVLDGLRLRPAGAPEPLTEVVQRGLGYVDPERPQRLRRGAQAVAGSRAPSAYTRTKRR